MWAPLQADALHSYTAQPVPATSPGPHTDTKVAARALTAAALRCATPPSTSDSQTVSSQSDQLSSDTQLHKKQAPGSAAKLASATHPQRQRGPVLRSFTQIAESLVRGAKQAACTVTGARITASSHASEASKTPSERHSPLSPPQTSYSASFAQVAPLPMHSQSGQHAPVPRSATQPVVQSSQRSAHGLASSMPRQKPPVLPQGSAPTTFDNAFGSLDLAPSNHSRPSQSEPRAARSRVPRNPLERTALGAQVSSRGYTPRLFHRQVFGQQLVLSVDDDPMNQTVVSSLLQPLGFKMVQAMNGWDALSALEEGAVLPDVILLDCLMPGMSGYVVASSVRAEYGASTPFQP